MVEAASIAEAYNLKFSTHLYPSISAFNESNTYALGWVDWSNPILQDTGFKVKMVNIIFLIFAQVLNGMKLILKNIKLIYNLLIK